MKSAMESVLKLLNRFFFPPPARRPSWTRILGASVLGIVLIIGGGSGLTSLLRKPAPTFAASNKPKLTTEALLAREHGLETLAPDIPKKIPDYSIEKSSFSSVHSGVKQWRLQSQRSNLFSFEKMVHARTVTAHLYDAEEQTTLITGKEARYFLDRQDLEVYGDVVTTFPDGFVILSPYLRYRPRERKIEIPVEYAVIGKNGPPPAGSKIKPSANADEIEFHSQGFDFGMDTSVITLLKEVYFELTRRQAEGARKKEKTEIRSDQAQIQRAIGRVEFTMSRLRLPSTRFVLITQPDLYARSRRAEMYYGDHAQQSSSQVINYLTAFEDVLIKEKETGTSDELRYSTSGRADFDTQKDVIHLTEFPQVYQDEDTIAGDRVILHKSSDLVEVENSNAYNKGR